MPHMTQVKGLTRPKGWCWRWVRLHSAGLHCCKSEELGTAPDQVFPLDLAPLSTATINGCCLLSLRLEGEGEDCGGEEDGMGGSRAGGGAGLLLYPGVYLREWERSIREAQVALNPLLVGIFLFCLSSLLSFCSLSSLPCFLSVFPRCSPSFLLVSSCLLLIAIFLFCLSLLVSFFSVSYIYIYISICLSVCLSIDLSVYLSGCLSGCLSVCQLVCVPVSLDGLMLERMDVYEDTCMHA